MQVNEEGQLLIGKRVQLKPYQPRPLIPYQLMSDAELMAGVGGTLVFDSECYSNYFLIAFRDILTDKVIEFESHEVFDTKAEGFNARKLSWIFHNYCCIGFNSIKYDWSMVWLAYNNQNTQNLKQLSNDLIQQNLWPYAAAKEYGFYLPNTNHIDLMEVAPLAASLKLYAARLHVKRIQDLPFAHDEPLEPWQKPIVKDYCINGDLPATKELALFMKERLELRQAMSMEYGENLMSKSDAQIAEAVLVKEVTEINDSKPKKPNIPPGTAYKYQVPNYIAYQTPALQKMLEEVRNATFVVSDYGYMSMPKTIAPTVNVGKAVYRLGIGGLHSSEECVSYYSTEDEEIVDRDVASYYPRLITTLKLFPESMGPAFLVSYEKIINSRLEAKRLKQFTADKGKKIVINGASGKFSDLHSTLRGPHLTIQMTVSGQLALLMFIEWMELAGIQVISANTDGIVMLVHKDKKEIYEQAYKAWEAKTGFATEETLYQSYHARDVNAYFAVKKNAKSAADVKVKGPYSEVGSQSGTKLDNNPVVLICSDAVKELLVNKTPIEQTILQCKDVTRFVTVRQANAPGAHKDGYYLGKVIRWVYGKNVQGAINYIASGNKVADTDGALPMMDLPDDFPHDLIDFNWYVDKTKKILYEIGYLVKPKQINFFE